MMEKDKRLVEKDRETIAKRISGKLYGVPQPIPGDMLSEEVERYLAEKAKSAKGYGQP